MNWVNAIKGKDEISCPFSYAAHLTEIMLLGVVSLRARQEAVLRPGQHAHHERVVAATRRPDGTPPPDANDLLTRKYRDGYSSG